MKVSKKRRCSGTTLVEMIVSFALLGLFMVAATAALSRSLFVYNRVKLTSYAQSVSDIIMDKLEGELAGASVGAKKTITISDGFYAGVDYTELKGDFSEYRCIAFEDRSGTEVYITTSEKELLIHYRPFLLGGKLVEAVNWKFDSKMYMGYGIESLEFKNYESDGKKTNIIEITLVLTNDRTGYRYETQRYVECYNFGEEDLNKIVLGMIPEDEKFLEK